MMAIPGRGGSATTDRSLPSLGDVDWPAVAAAGLVGYALGSLSPAAAAARLRGADLRGTGSGNPGATNAARTMGVKIGVRLAPFLPYHPWLLGRWTRGRAIPTPPKEGNFARWWKNRK